MELDQLHQVKAELRREMTARRESLSAEAPAAGAEVALRVSSAFAPSPGSVVAGYWPIRAELDCLPTLNGLAARGCRIGLPEIQGPGQPLVFRGWEPDEELDAGPFGTRQPSPEAEAVEPTLLLVPLLAFDAQGRRLGYGGGYYDRTLALLRGVHAVQAIGLAFAGQQIDEVPAGPEDAPLDGVITETDFHDFTG